MGAVSIPHTFANGGTQNADANQVNANFTALRDHINNELVHKDGSVAMTGALTLPASDPSTANHATRKAYVDSRYTICTSSTRPGSPVNGSVIYETDTQREWRWNGSAWVLIGGKPPRVRCTATTPVAISTGTLTVVPWNSESVSYPDTDNFHSTSTNTSRITIPAGLGGTYNISYAISFAGVSGGGDRQAYFVNSANSVRQASSTVNVISAGVGCQLTGSATIPCAAGDILELVVFQNSGVACNVNPSNLDYFEAVWVGPA